MSRLGMNTKEFYDMTPVELDFALEDFAERERLMAEVQQQTLWETTRMQMFHSERMNPHIKKGRRAKKPEDILKFKWEKTEKSEKEKLKEMKNSLKQIHLGAFLRSQKGRKKQTAKKP